MGEGRDLVCCRCSFLPIVAALLCAPLAASVNVLYLPLDERFTTRDAFLNLAAVTPFNISTPDVSIISQQRAPANTALLDAWTSAAFAASDAAVVSLELYLYGGLISSRISNASTADVLARLDALVALKLAHPNVRLHAGQVVMRIPSYNTAPNVEDVWYWEFHGADLFEYSFFTSKYAQTHNASDLAQAQAAEARVPADIVADWLWRRARNFNVTVALLERAGATPGLLRSLYITQDDNALFGFNIDEAAALRALAQQLGLLGSVVRIYPGADEVGLSMLGRLASETMQEAAASCAQRSCGGAVPAAGPLEIDVVFRRADNASLYLVPNYEGQPMIATLREQIAAAGATAPGLPGAEAQRRSDGGRGSGRGVVLLVNNFGTDEFPQKEASEQTTEGRSTADYAVFSPYICGAGGVGNVVSLVSNRYSNGADVLVVQYLEELADRADCASAPPTSNVRGLGLDRLAFAGWNTDGNSLGCAISNLVVLAYFADFGAAAEPPARLWARASALAAERRGALPASPQRRALSASAANAYFNALRMTEDDFYQAGLRQTLAAYSDSVNGEGSDGLGLDLAFYERFAFKPLSSRFDEIVSTFGGLSLSLVSAGFPWNRTFEISLVASPRSG